MCDWGGGPAQIYNYVDDEDFKEKLRKQQDNARKTIDSWPEYKKKSIIRNGKIVSWKDKDADSLR